MWYFEDTLGGKKVVKTTSFSSTPSVRDYGSDPNVFRTRSVKIRMPKRAEIIGGALELTSIHLGIREYDGRMMLES